MATFQSANAWVPRKESHLSIVTSRTIPTMQRSCNTGQEHIGLVANDITDSRLAARRMRRQYPQQPIAQLKHHYHHQHQRPMEQQKPHHNSRGVFDGPPRLVTSLTSSGSTLERSLPLKLSSSMELRRSDLGSSKPAALHLSSDAVGMPVLRSTQTTKMSSNPSVDTFSPSSSGRGTHNETHDSGGGQSTPYEQWRRLRRSRTASGNSCASTSSTSSFASYVINPSTGRYNFGLGSDDEVEDDEENLDSMMDIKVGKDRQEGLPSVLQHIIAPSLPPPPYPVDPYHFYCISKRTNVGAGTAGADVTSMLAALFAESGIEAIFHPLKCKFKCLKYVHYSHVEFVVRVYAHQRTLLVEFQRRSGSVLLWDGLYRILYQKLALVIDANALPCSQSSGQKRVARDSATLASESRVSVTDRRDNVSSNLTPSQSLDHNGLGTQIWRTLSLKKPTPSSGVEAMKIMLTSRYQDAMREGCTGLAELTEDVQNSCLVARADLVLPLIQAAEATDLSMSRCAIGTLANIARAVPRFPETELVLARRTAQQLRVKAIPVVLTQLEHVNEQSLFSIDLLRECARALGAFAGLVTEMDPRFLAASSVNDERCKRILRLYSKHCDSQLASNCRAALEQLRLGM